MCHKEAGDWDWWGVLHWGKSDHNWLFQLVRDSTVQRTNKTSGAHLLPLAQLEVLTLMNTFRISHRKRRSVTFYFHNNLHFFGDFLHFMKVGGTFQDTSERLFHSPICCKWLIFHCQGSVCRTQKMNFSKVPANVNHNSSSVLTPSHGGLRLRCCETTHTS